MVRMMRPKGGGRYGKDLAEFEICGRTGEEIELSRALVVRREQEFKRCLSLLNN